MAKSPERGSRRPKSPSAQTDFACRYCDATYKTARGLHEHQCKKGPLHLESGAFECRRCHNHYKTENGYARHACSKAPVMTPEGEFACKRCGEAYRQEFRFNAHICAPKEIRQKQAEKIPCGYCDRSFVREAAYLQHNCKIKLRHLDKDRVHVRVGYMTYVEFLRTNFRRLNSSYEEFAKSPYYEAFVRFGKYIVDTDALEPMEFVKFLLQMNQPVDRWCVPSVYETYVRELAKKESADRAVARNIALMEKWAADTGESWFDFFRKVPPALATLWIVSGRISPWVLYSAESGGALFARMSDEQMTLVQKYIEPKFWGLKLQRHEAEVEAIRETLKECGA